MIGLALVSIRIADGKKSFKVASYFQHIVICSSIDGEGV
jgi:hypothetical protein